MTAKRDEAGDGRRAGMRAWLGFGLALIVALVVAGLSLARFTEVSSEQLASPYDLMQETPVAATIRLLQDGGNPYDPAVYADVPFVVTVYTPLYQMLSAALPGLDDHPFRAGRIVSLVSVLVAAATLLVLGRRSPLGLAAAGAFLLVWPVTAYATYVKNDPLAVMLGVWSVMAVSRPTPGRVVVAALLAVLALAAKQSMVAAGLAGLLFLLFRDRRLAWRYVAAGALCAGVLAVLATLSWGRGFWFATVVMPGHPISASAAWAWWTSQVQQPLFGLMLGISLLLVVSACAGGPGRALSRSPFLLYLLVSGAVLSATVGVQGASTVYFMEFALAMGLWLVDAGKHPAAPRAASVLILSGLLLGAIVEWQGDGARARFAMTPRATTDGYYAAVRAGLAHAGHESPRVLNIGPPRHAYGIADDVCMSDYGTYDMLYTEGKLDTAPLERALAEQAFDVVLLTRQATPERVAGEPWEAVVAAVERHYELLWQDAVYTYFVR